MRKHIFTIALTFMVLFSVIPVFAHGDDGDHDEPMQIQTPAEVSGPAHTVFGLPMEIIPNWHPLLVHFTIALLLSATLLFVIGKLTPARVSWREACLTVARWNLILGVLISIGTVVAGWYAFDTVNHDNFSHLPMLSHRLWALSTAVFFAILGFWSFVTHRKEPQSLFILSLVAASVALAVTGFKGGELVYRHGLGVMSMPQADDHMGHHDAGSPMTMPEMKDMPGMDKK